MNCDRLFKLTLAAVLSLGFAACTTAEVPAPEEAAEAPAEAPVDAPAAEAPAAGTETAEAPADAPAAGAALKSGMFVGAEKPTEGAVRVVSEGDKTFVELGEDFKTGEGPDLFVTLHKSEDVLATTEPPAYPLKEGEYVTLELLKGFSGTSRYEVPAEVNLDEYNSVVIWCREFNATFGVAKLAAAQ